MKEFNSPPPQPEDPGRALDPGLEEDPDISVEFVDGTFYQARSDGSLVAIIADYPGLLPMSHVSNVKLPKGFLRFAVPYHRMPCFYRNIGRDAVRNPRGLLSKRRLDKVGLKGRRLGAIRRRRGIH